MANIWRCVVTGTNGIVVYSDAVHLLPTTIIDGEVQYIQITATTVKLVAYNGSSSSVLIPDTVEGMKVTEIGEGAFENNTTLESIDLPDSITVIGKRAFKGCSNLSEMN